MMNDIIPPKNTEDLEEIQTTEEIKNDFTVFEKPKPKNPCPRKKGFFKFLAYLSIFAFTILAVFSSQVLISKHDTDSWIASLPIFKQIKNLAESAEKELKGEEQNRINIILLGIGGKNHDGGNLTDTIILTSLNPKDKKVAMTSIPRDLAVPIENHGWGKINSINAYAEKEEPGTGSLATSQAISDLLDVPIDYYIKVDFEGFMNIVDELGGVDVLVENTLDDYSYPVMGREDDPSYNSRYEHLHVEKGLQHMDGSLALKFARSRHGINGEGSDFARAKRQQLVIEAIKEKALSAKNLLKPVMLTNIFNELSEHIDTNLKVWEIVKLWDNFKDVTKDDITNKVLDNSPSGLLVNERGETGAYLLAPRSGDFKEIQYFVKNIFEDQATSTVEEKIKVEIRNGTWINGLASKEALDVEKLGFIVTKIGNASRQNFEKSVIYDLSYGEKMKSLTLLKEATGANISFGLPDWLKQDIENEITDEEDPIEPDFVLVLGQNADETHSGAANVE